MRAPYAERRELLQRTESTTSSYGIVFFCTYGGTGTLLTVCLSESTLPPPTGRVEATG